MGKDDLLKSTTKSKQKSTTKKAAASKSKTKKKTGSKKATKKAQAKNVKKTSTVQKTDPQQTPKKKLTYKELILKQYDLWQPKKLFKVEVAKSDLDNFVSPPFDFAKDQAEKVKSLLLNKYDLNEIKAAGEKYAAAEKAAAEKAAAEKAAAEKAAAEKAAAEKAAAEKAAAEKAAAEKAAAEKAAAETQIPQSPAVSNYSNLPDQSDIDKEAPVKMKKTIVALVICLIIVIAPILAASISNSVKFYLKPSGAALEVWKGDFAPMGKSRLMTLPGVTAPKPMKAVYCKSEVFPIIFNYYIGKIDALTKEPGIPNFETIHADLNRALCYASSKELSDIANQRLDTIKFLVLLYKAEVAANQKDVDSLHQALGYLEETKRLNIDADQTALIEKKVADINKLLSSSQPGKN